MVIEGGHVITILLCLLNLIGGLILVQVSDFKKFLKETRALVDVHISDKAVHCDIYKAKVLHAQER